jgi:DNA invertase Pin-like site-specific DNA recombinase
LWYGGHADVTLRRCAKWGDGWMPLAYPPGEEARTAFATLHRYAEEAGRDPATLGIDTRVSAGAGAEAEWREQVRFPAMIYGYARVSTGAQDLGSQLAELKAAGCGKVFREKVTGTTADRPQLKQLMAALAPGDVVITPAVDRLSRDATDLLVIARDMQRAGAGLRSIAEPVVDTTSDFAELVLAMLGVAAKLERRRIAERTARGRADAKAKGVKFGRKPTLTPHQKREARERLDAGETQRSVARSYNVSQATISRLPP